MDIELAATHEAAHAVMQWLVGWEVGELQMTVSETTASEPVTRCPPPPLDTLSALRRRLLVLLAGNTATLSRWPNSWNDWGDWNRIGEALWRHYGRNILRVMSDGRSFRDPEANAVVQDALGRCGEIVAQPLVREATAQVAAAFLAAPRGEGGLVRLEEPAAVAICESVLGEGFRAENPWSAWMCGEPGVSSASSL